MLPDAAGRRPRRIAITFDDLPMMSVTSRAPERRRAWTNAVLAALAAAQVPAVGFVNEAQLHRERTQDPDELALLEAWLDHGHELGNHTYGHLDLHHVPVAEFIADVTRGQSALAPLLAARGRSVRWFRHPYLHTGLDLETRRAVESHLEQLGLTAAPITVYTHDYLFSAAYEWTLHARHRARAERIATEFVTHFERTLVYAERASTALFGREIPLITLLHANPLIARRLPELLAVLIARGYEFVTLEEALADPAYASTDAYFADQGVTWFERWAMTRGFTLESIVPAPDPSRRIHLAAGTPLHVTIRRRAVQLREQLYQHYKKPLLDYQRSRATHRH